jgi:hypothetical protein
VIATDPGTITRVQGVRFSSPKTRVVATAIIVERQEDDHAYPVHRPVYFVSEVLSESKAWCQPVQKLLYAVLITSRKLRHYF